MSIVKIFYDLETTGTDVKKHSIHQIAGIIEVDGKIATTFNLHTRPHPKAQYDQGAMEVCRVTPEQLLAYPDMKEVYKEMLQILGNYVDRFDRKNKAYLVGFRNCSFDDIFLRAWFEQNNDSFFGSWFWSNSLDVSVLATQYLLNRRVDMSSFKLKRVAQELGIVIDKDRLHEASYDVELTRDIYRIVTGLEYEL